MNISSLGLFELVSYESICLTPYLDSRGVKTVGVGSTVSDIPDLASWSWDKKITVQEALRIYRTSLEKYITAVNNALRVEVTQELFDALVSITYNIGIGGMQRSTFMKLINEKASISEITHAIMQWNEAGGKISKGLINRREKECNLILTGVYSSNGWAQLVPVINKYPNYVRSFKINLTGYIDNV